jgi:hypothetical protein
MIQSATFKLTLWYLGILMLLSALFSMALYRESASQIYENADHQRQAIRHLPLPPEFEPRRVEFLTNLESQLDNDLGRITLRLLILNLGTLMLGGAACARSKIRWKRRAASPPMLPTSYVRPSPPCAPRLR